MPRVFISYHTPDRSHAEELAREIRAVGNTVWFEAWEISLGDSIIQKINQGLEQAEYVVLCFTPSGVNRPWLSREWMSTLAQQLNGRNIKLLPVRLTGGAPPAILADIRYADLEADWRNGVSELLRAIGSS